LTGPPGIGKTRLSQQVAQEARDLYASGVFFIALALVTEPDHVLSTIAQALGVHEVGTESLRERLQAFLHAREMLLVLDNLEQVLPAGPQLADLLAAAPRVQMLGTSRERLHLYGEQEYVVPPLALPTLPALQGRSGVDRAWADVADAPAVQLFIQRAQAANADFTLNRANAPAVAELCIRLDGLPLAIELTAAGSRLFGPRALLARLVHRLDPLTAGARNLPARQQTLRGSIRWSYELLDRGERLLFARLGVFVGGCTVESAEAVCNAEGDLPGAMLDRLAALADKSLLRHEEGGAEKPRFTMLETIREYAVEQLAASGEAEALQQAHAPYFLALVEEAEPELRGAQGVAWLERLEVEHDNLRAALRWMQERDAVQTGLRLAGALWWFWVMRGYLSEGRKWLADTLSQPRAAIDSSVRAKALNGAGALARMQGDYTSARSLLEESLTISREVGDKSSIARSLNNLGIVADYQGDYAAAHALYEESLTIYRELGDKQGIANLLNNLGYLAYYQGDYAAAHALLEEGLTIFRELGDKWGIAESLGSLGLVAHAQGDYAAARALLEERLALYRELGEKLGIAYALEGFMRLAAQGEVERVARLGGAAEALREAIGAPMLPHIRAGYEQDVAVAHAQVDEVVWEAAWTEGRALTPDQAISYALEVNDPADSD
jgi:predicted ATPase/Tfp pilus assembly protein PilF